MSYLLAATCRASITVVCTWSFGGEWFAADLDQSKAAIHRALELGITLFATAQGYGFDAAEQLLGEALRQRVRREDVPIATKGGLRRDGDTLVRDASAGWLREGVESSLRNLGTEYIDIYQVHWPDLRTPAEQTAGALDELVREGKVRHVGVSNYDVDEMEEVVLEMAADQPTIGALERAMIRHAPTAVVRPVICHLFWLGQLAADLSRPLDHGTQIQMTSGGS